MENSTANGYSKNGAQNVPITLTQKTQNKEFNNTAVYFGKTIWDLGTKAGIVKLSMPKEVSDNLEKKTCGIL